MATKQRYTKPPEFLESDRAAIVSAAAKCAAALYYRDMAAYEFHHNPVRTLIAQYDPQTRSELREAYEIAYKREWSQFDLSCRPN